MTKVNDKSEGLSDHQVRALVQLLTDENIKVAETVRAKILELGSRVIPFLHEVLEQKDEGLRGQAQDFLAYFREDEKLHQFGSFSNGSVDLEEGVFLLAQVAYPDLNIEAYRKNLDDMASALAKRFHWNDDPKTVIQIINNYLFVERGFRGNTDDYFNPENSYLNRVLDRGLGIPISLSAVYLFVSRRLDLPIVGVGMPGHFLIAYQGEGQTLFLDPFNSGQIMTRKTCVQFLKKAGYGWREDFLDVCQDREILARMIRNLIASYTTLGENKQANQLSRYLQILIS